MRLPLGIAAIKWCHLKHVGAYIASGREYVWEERWSQASLMPLYTTPARALMQLSPELSLWDRTRRINRDGRRRNWDYHALKR